MIRTFETKLGEKLTPGFFAVFFNKNGSTFIKIQDSIDVSDAENYEDVKKIELYENGTENLAPIMIDSVYIK